MYKLSSKIQTLVGVIDADTVIRVSDNTYIPFDPANTDYQAYLKWLEEGNQPLPADE